MSKTDDNVSRLVERIRRLEDIEAIKQLMTHFARGADNGCDPSMLRPLFTDDAVFEVGDFGNYIGGDEIARSMHANNKLGFYWTLHYLISPEIHVANDGNTATVFYYIWEPAASRREDTKDQAYWIGGWYEGKVNKEQDYWRYSYLKLTLKLLSPYAEGWQATSQSFEEV